MPIRINLLAESQAADEERRKDPVKRAFYGAGFAVFLVLLWATTLQLKIMASGSDLSGLEAQWKGVEGAYQEVVGRQRQAIDAEQKLTSLNALATNRFAWATVLNAVQKAMNGVEGVQVVRWQGQQQYKVTEATPVQPNNPGSGKPATSAETISMTIEAMDMSRPPDGGPPGGQVNKFKESVANVPFFKEHLMQTNGVRLISLSAPQMRESGKGSFVKFTVQCFFPERVR